MRKQNTGEHYDLRNKASHRQNQSIYWPAVVLGLLETITEDINALCPY